jgi:hypothetical protein
VTTPEAALVAFAKKLVDPRLLEDPPPPGDLINIAITGKLVVYKVDFVAFNPFTERNQITLGCSFFSAPTVAAAGGEPVDLKERMDQVVDP